MPARSICTRSPLNLFNHRAPPPVNNSTNNKDCEKQEGEKEIYIQEKKKKVCVVFKDDLKNKKTSLICFAWEKGILVFCSECVCGKVLISLCAAQCLFQLCSKKRWSITRL